MSKPKIEPLSIDGVAHAFADRDVFGILSQEFYAIEAKLNEIIEVLNEQ